MFRAKSERGGIFEDRSDAGRVLAGLLQYYRDRDDVFVLALPRGGVPVGFEVAKALNAPLEVFMVRKLGVPGHEELALGALASSGGQVINEGLVRALRLEPDEIAHVVQREQHELQRREREYLRGRPPPRVRGKTVILVDDGLATGSTMRAAAQAIRQQDPARLIIAVPTGAAETCEQLRLIADEVICATTPEPFHAVGLWYHNFGQLTDEDVRHYLERARRPDSPRAMGDVNHGFRQG